MKEEVKMKENMNVEPMGTMPQVGAMPQMKAAPAAAPAQMTNPAGVMPASMNSMPMPTNPTSVMPASMNAMPMQTNPMGVMPSMMNPMPMMCCPYLMNMQCPMTYGANVMGMNMMNNPMLSGVSPVSGNNAPVLGAANGMMPGMGTMPAMNNFYPMGGM